MKLNALTVFLGFTTLLLGITSWNFHMQIDLCKEIIIDRELTITNYKKVIHAIGRSSEISIEKLKPSLAVDFNLGKIVYNNFGNEHSVSLCPLNIEINHTEI